MLQAFHLINFLHRNKQYPQHDLCVPSSTTFPIRILQVTSATVRALEMEERPGNTSAQQESIQVCLRCESAGEPVCN